jgi:hypothetical protein
MFLLFLVTAGIVAAIVMKILKVNDDVAQLPGPNNSDDVRHPLLSHHALQYSSAAVTD